MATPTIEAISTQDITIDTDYELEIGITGDPEEVTVDGLMEGFGYSWDAANDTLTIAGEATRLLGDAIWVVSAKETSSSTAVTREITYNVVSGAPIIQELGTQTIYQGTFNDIFVEVANSPTQIQVETLLVGLKHEPDTVDEVEGIRISGTPDRDANFTIDGGDMRILASNDGGEDTYNLPFDIEDLAASLNSLFYGDKANDEFLVVNRDSTFGSTAALERYFNAPNNLSEISSITSNLDNLFIADRMGSTSYNIIEINKDALNAETATSEREFTQPRAQTLRGIAYDFETEDIYYCYSDEIHISASDIADGETATTIRSFDLSILSGWTLADIDVSGAFLYIAANNRNQIAVVSKDTDDNTEAEFESVIYLVADNNLNCKGLSIQSNKIYYLTSSGVVVYDINDKSSIVVENDRHFTVGDAGQVDGGMDIDNTHIYLYDGDSDDFELFDKTLDTGNSYGDPTSTFSKPTSIDRIDSIAIDGDSIYCLERDLNNLASMIHEIPKNTADGQTATIIKSFQVPSEVDVPISIAIRGNDIYCAGEGIHIFSKNTLDGQTATRTRFIDTNYGTSTYRNPGRIKIDGDEIWLNGNDAGYGDFLYVIDADSANNTLPDIIRNISADQDVGHEFNGNFAISGDELYGIYDDSNFGRMRVYTSHKSESLSFQAMTQGFITFPQRQGQTNEDWIGLAIA